MPTYSAMPELINGLEKACEKAVKQTCNRLLKVLQTIINEEYYDVYTPKEYERTYQFLEAATTRMVSQLCGEIFMNPEAMNYKTPIWTGMRQLTEANIGSHGGIITPETTNHEYWNRFIEYCDKNAVRMLKEDLRGAGLKVQ